MLLSFTSNFFQNIIQSLFNVNKSQAKVGIKLNIGNGICKNSFLPCFSSEVVLMVKCWISLAYLVMVSENHISFYWQESELIPHTALLQYQPVHNQTTIAEETKTTKNLTSMIQFNLSPLHRYNTIKHFSGRWHKNSAVNS